MTTPHDKALARCPFCGSSRTEGMFIRDGWSVECLDCSARVSAYHPDAHGKAAEKWNRRAPIPEAGNGDGWNHDMDAAPKDRQFLAFGHYFYPGDKNPTIYTMIAEISLGDPEWPYRTSEGTHRRGFFSHWRPLPPPPSIRSSDTGREG
ncbi:Lar family restriction alleviation protein [Rhizobium sp. WW_1]|jgi:Lar family restriction alleviation protein|nr:Lar family restriction alleviation protein [Rhizobium sp. WW_1]